MQTYKKNVELMITITMGYSSYLVIGVLSLLCSNKKCVAQTMASTTETSDAVEGPRGPVTERSDDSIWTAIRLLKERVQQLERDKIADRALMREFERRGSQHQNDMTAQTQVIKDDVQVIQDRLIQVEASVETIKLSTESLKLGQKQIKSEMYKKLKDSTRRSIKKLDKNIEKNQNKLKNLEEELKNMSSNLDVTKSMIITRDFYKENLPSIESLVENRTKTMIKEKFRNLRSKMNDFYYNLTLASGPIQVVPQEEGFGSGELDTEFIFPSNPDNTKNRNSVNTTDDEIPIGILPHSHRNYLKMEDFYFEIEQRDDEISDLEDMYDEMRTHMERVEERLTSIQLGDFMGKLQESLLNFTQNVITLDQWKMASTEIVNSTQLNQHQISLLTNMILNNTNHLNEVEYKIAEAEGLGYQQFNLLRMYVIQLNNSMQDMKESMNKWRKSPPAMNVPIPSSHHVPRHAPQSDQRLDTMTSRLEDLALQIIYNENRIAKLEIKSLNDSLTECRKYSKDVEQDSHLIHVEQDIQKLIESGIIVKEMVSRLDRGLFKIHLTNKNQSEMIDRVLGEVSFFQGHLGVLSQIKHEVDHMTLMIPKDCHEYYRHGYTDSGVYIIYPSNTNHSIKIHCDMEDGVGGWTVIQRRMNGSVDFNRAWNDYKYGFGMSDSEYWLGNDIIHSFTTYKNYSLKIDMIDVDNKYWWAVYDEFHISNESDAYRLYIDGYQGNSTNALSYSKGMGFSTPDQDNDGSSTHCAMYYTSGWWYKHCHYGNLNGRYRLGMVWYNYDEGDWITLKEVTMKLKPVTR